MTRIAALAISTLICTFPAHAIEPKRLSDIDNVVTAFGDATVCGSEVEFPAVEGENIVELAADSSETTYVAFPVLGSCEHAAFEPIVIRAEYERGYIVYVDLHATAELDFQGFPHSAITAVEAIAPNRVRVVGKKHVDGDASCCPTGNFDEVYRWKSGGIWQIE